MKHIDALSTIYEHVDNVDYFVASLLEKSKPGSMLGQVCFSDWSMVIDFIMNLAIRWALLN